MVIEHEIDLSLTESLIPATVHVKQFDHMARKLRCRLYKDALAYPIPETAVLTYFGTRPDGRAFQYGSDTTPELVFYDEGAVVITITDFMTEVYGRFPVDISVIAESGDVLSTFCMVLKVEASAVRNRSLASLTYAGCLKATLENISSCFITEDGYFGVYSDNGLDLKTGSYSGTVAKVAEVIEDGLIESSITDDGIGAYESADMLGLDISVDGDGNLVVLFGEDAKQ